MDYKLVVSDCDGTLLKDDLTISKQTICAIKAFKKNGGKFIIATGRMFKASKKVIKMLKLDGEGIFYQGSAIYDIKTKKQIMIFKLDKKPLLDFVLDMEENNHVIQIYDEFDNCFIKEKNPYSKLYAKACSIKPKVVNMKISSFLKKHPYNFIKVVVLMKSENFYEIVESNAEKYKDSFIVNNSSNSLMEVVDKNAGKGKAIKWYADRYGISKEEIIAIGDSANDLPMFEYAGLKVAVANAEEKLKKNANLITVSNNEDGVCKILNEYCR